MNGGSFCGLREYESMPVSKWLQLLGIHNDAVEEQKRAAKG
jgi:hypothetical protein